METIGNGEKRDYSIIGAETSGQTSEKMCLITLLHQNQFQMD